MDTDTQEKQQLDDFVKLAIEGAKTLMRMAHNIEADIRYRMVAKNNGLQPGLTFSKEEEKISPTIYIKNYFDRYKSGEDIGSIVKEIADAAYHGMMHSIKMPVITPEEARRCIRLDLGGVEKNREYLEHVPHYIIGEGEGALAAYPRWEIDSNASFKVTEEIAAQLQMTPTEVLALASENTNKMQYKIEPIGVALHHLVQDMETFSDEVDQMLMDTDQSPPMLVMTTPDCVHGASAILSHDAMEQARKMLGCESEDVYIIPSSIHEVLVVPAREIKAEDLKEMIMDVNRTQLAPEEILSDFPLKYDGQKISMAIEEPKMEMVTDDSMKVERHMAMVMA